MGRRVHTIRAIATSWRAVSVSAPTPSAATSTVRSFAVGEGGRVRARPLGEGALSGGGGRALGDPGGEATTWAYVQGLPVGDSGGRGGELRVCDAVVGTLAGLPSSSLAAAAVRLVDIAAQKKQLGCETSLRGSREGGGCSPTPRSVFQDIPNVFKAV